MHARRDDPWHVTSSWYEIRKRAVTLASLPAEHYGSVLEIGCSIGVVTEELSARADDVLALDLSDEAVGRARLRLAARENARVEQCDVLEGIPVGPFDLVVLSEVGYYLTAVQLGELVGRIRGVLSAGGDFVACHWRHPESDFRQSGDSVHEIVRSAPGFAPLVHHEEADFVLDVVTAEGGLRAEYRPRADVSPELS
jgi:SAM-dependent methyltransferase